jgi:hypothetical protein
MDIFATLPSARYLPCAANDKHPADLHTTTLKRLADELSVPPETFSSDPSEGDALELLALVRHWLAIQDTPGRRRVLSTARLCVFRRSRPGIPI